MDLDAGLIEKAKKSIRVNLERVAKKNFKDDPSKISEFVEKSMGRISSSTDILDTVKNSGTDLVIEAIVENLSVKQKLFASIDGVSSLT